MSQQIQMSANTLAPQQQRNGKPGLVQQTPQIHLSNSVAPPQMPYQNHTAKNANPGMSQSNFMQFGLNTLNPMNSVTNVGSPLQSPYAHGLAQKQFPMQNQAEKAKGGNKEIQLIQAYQQHTQKLKDQSQPFKKSRG